MSQMPDEKKARLEAIRAANRAGQQAEGSTPPAPEAPVAAATTEAPSAQAATPAASAGAGVSMPDDKKARLEAIRAANRAKQGAAPPVAAPATTQAAPVTPGAPAATTAAPAQQRPAARGVSVPKPPQPIEDDPQPFRKILLRAAIGAVIGMILCVLLASMTGEYLLGAIWGLILGAITGVLVLSWPPQRTTSD